MSNLISPTDRLKEINDSPEKLREKDCVNEYLQEESYINIVEEKNGKNKYIVTELGKTILKRLN